MEIRAIWQVVSRRWWLILLPTVVALLVSLPALKSIISPPVSYSATVRFTASAKPNGTGNFQDQSYTPWLASEYAVTNLASWVQTQSFAREVVDQMGQSSNPALTIEQVQSVIRADSARSVMTLYLGSWPNADQLKTIGQACVSVLQNKAAIYLPQTDAQPFLVVPLDDVVVSAAVPSLNTRLAPLARVGIGLVLGLVLAFLIEYFDRSLRSRTEVEALGLAVIAEIPQNNAGH